MPARTPPSTVLRHAFLGLDTASIKRSISNALIYHVGKDSLTATPRDWFNAIAYAVRQRLTERWMETTRSYYARDARRAYYFSLEYLIGRSLGNNLSNLGILDETREAARELGLDLDALAELEPDAALGNGGLGRLAACLLDSMATLRLPGYGYGIRYEYGMFYQRIEDGWQVEQPDNWLRYGNPWEFPRPEVLYPVRFYGRVVEYRDDRGRTRHHWVDTEQVMAMAYDTPVAGYNTNTVNNLRLWSAKATRDLDLRYFNQGDYIRAVEEKTLSENLSKVLYPEDTTTMGRELRLRQQYFFVSASLQDIVRRFLAEFDDWDLFPDKVAVQLNDTHPAVAIPELMRQLLDLHDLDWDRAWDITRRTFAYTNHTLMPEALETWPLPLFERMLPRHMQIIYDINHHMLTEVAHRFPGDLERLRRMSIIDETGERAVRMAHLAAAGSHTVNGVSEIHTRLMRQSIFRDFDELDPERIVNITNGITPRRWLLQCNPELSAVLRRRIGSGWAGDLERLRALEQWAEDPGFQEEFRAAKLANKRRLAALIDNRLGLQVDPESLFDVQVKRIHEYKRQLLNCLHVVDLYRRIRNGEAADAPPRTVIFSGKAAPGYRLAKLIIKLINDIAAVIDDDPATEGRLKVVFVPNYDVSTAEDIIPAAELSEQISTAGTEASGTGNMKLALNGALTIGTLDGANIEIREAVGEEHMFIFGLDAEGVSALREQGYRPREYVDSNPALAEALEMIGGGCFSAEEPGRFQPLVQSLLDGGDPFMVLADFQAYLDCQRRVERLYRDATAWTRSAILNVGRMGRFSSDRTVKDYAERIWKLLPVTRD